MDEGGTISEVCKTFCFPRETFKRTASSSSLGQSWFAFVNRSTRLLQGKRRDSLSFPPHCSHKLQPLDRSVFGPQKTYVNRACDAWITNNPGQTMAIYDLPGIVKMSLNSAATPANIKAGFLATGIFPYNRCISWWGISVLLRNRQTSSSYMHCSIELQ